MSYLTIPFIPAFGALGEVAPAAKLYFYLTGTSTPAPIYADAGLTTPLTNPVTANISGRFVDIFVDDSITYRIRLETALGALIDEVDPFVSPLGAISAPTGSSLVGFLQAGTGAQAQTVQGQLRNVLSIQSFATQGGIVDATGGFRNAVARAVETGNYLDGHGASFRLTEKIDIPLTGSLRLRNVTLIVDHSGTGIGQATAGGGGDIVDRCYFENVRIMAEQDAAIAWDCVTFQNCDWINCVVGSNDGTSVFTRAWKFSNASYWNTLVSPEIQAGPIAFDLNDCNDAVFFKPKHVRFGTLANPSSHALNSVLFSGGASGVHFYGCSFENLYTGTTSITCSTTNGSANITSVAGGTLYVGQHVTGSGIPANTYVVSVAGSNATLSQNATATASGVAITRTADVISFHPDCEHCFVFGGRIEARADSSNVLPVSYNSAEGNGIFGLYMTGGGISNITDIATSPNNMQHVFQGVSPVTTPHMGKGYLVLPYNTANAGETGAVNYNATSGRFNGNTAAGGTRDFVQSPALDPVDMNGNTLNNVGMLVLNNVASSPGAGKVSIGNGTATTVGAAGAASALPANPLGYLIGFVGATQVKIPYYNA